jgi:hypothetical protein
MKIDIFFIEIPVDYVNAPELRDAIMGTTHKNLSEAHNKMLELYPDFQGFDIYVRNPEEQCMYLNSIESLTESFFTYVYLVNTME